MMGFHILFNAGEIAGIPYIDDGLHDIVLVGTCFVEQGGDIFDHAFGLFDHIPRMDDFAIPVDASRTGYEDMAAVAIGDGNASFKSHSVFISPAQMVGGI